MPIDLNSINALLKRVYTEKQIIDQQNRVHNTFNKVPEAKDKPTGQNFFFPILLAGAQEGLGSQNELEQLRKSGVQRNRQAVIGPKIITNTQRYAGLAIAMATSDTDSFAKTVTYQIDEGTTDALKEANGQLFRDGSGLLCRTTAAAVAGATVITVDNPQYLKQFEELDGFDAATNLTKQMDGKQIDSINLFTKQVTLKTPLAANLDNGAFLYRKSVHDAPPADGKEMAGFERVIDDGSVAATFEGIARVGADSFDAWKGILVNAGGVNLTNDLLQKTHMRMKVAGAPEPSMKVAHPQQTRKYLDIVTPLKRFDKTNDLDSGYKMLEHNGIAWMEDTDAKQDSVYYINFDHFKKYVVRRISPDDTDGNIIKWDPNFDGFVSYIKGYMNFGSNRPNALARLYNLNVPSF